MPSLSDPSTRSQPMSDNRPIVYYDSAVEAWVYRASSVGRSLRCLTSARQGYDPLPAPDYLIEAAEAGNKYEGIVKSRLRAEGWKIGGEQGSLDFEVKPGVVIRGHLDGRHCLAPDDPTDRILEVKSMSQRVFDKWIMHSFDKFPEYAAQVTIYMHAEGQIRRLDTPPEATYAVVNRDTDELDIRTLKTPPLEVQSIIQKVALAELFAEQSQLPVCDSASQYTCPYDYLCDRHEILFEELEDGKEKTLKQLGDKYVEALKAEKVVQENKEEIRRDIRVAMGSREKLTVPGYTFTNRGTKRRELDLVNLRKRLGDELEEFFVDKETKPSLRVYPKKD